MSGESRRSAHGAGTREHDEPEVVMRRVRYSVAMSLDGYIAGPAGEFDWIIMDPTVDFAAFYQEFDTVLMGRRTFAIARGNMPGMRAYVFSRTLDARDHPGVTIIAD